MNKVAYTLFIIVLIALQCACLSQRSLSHQTKTGTDPKTGLPIQYGCYKSKCWSQCLEFQNMWCWTNSKPEKKAKACTSDNDCDDTISKCQMPCGR